MPDIQFPNILLGPGTVTATIFDNNGAPATVLEADQPFTVHADWQIAAYVESIGPGPEQQIGPTVTVPLTGATSYSADITVPANTLPDNPAPPNSGVYKTVTVLTHTNFGAVTDVVGLVEGPVLRIG